VNFVTEKMIYRKPTIVEMQFLRIVTEGHRELREQVEYAEVCDYDVDGYCDVRISHGPPLPILERCDGPELFIPGGSGSVGTILWVNNEGMLDTIELLEDVMSFSEDIYRRFVNGAAAGWLHYP